MATLYSFFLKHSRAIAIISQHRDILTLFIGADHNAAAAAAATISTVLVFASANLFLWARSNLNEKQIKHATASPWFQAGRTQALRPPRANNYHLSAT